EHARKIKDLMLSHDAFLISTPEYNSSMPPLVKNTIDWCSRKNSKEEAPLSAYKGKVGAVISASPGGLGGIRSLALLRALLSYVGVIMVPSQFALAKAHEAFDPDGNLKDTKVQGTIEQIVKELISVTQRLKS